MPDTDIFSIFSVWSLITCATLKLVKLFKFLEIFSKEMTALLVLECFYRELKAYRLSLGDWIDLSLKFVCLKSDSKMCFNRLFRSESVTAILIVGTKSIISFPNLIKSSIWSKYIEKRLKKSNYSFNFFDWIWLFWLNFYFFDWIKPKRDQK